MYGFLRSRHVLTFATLLVLQFATAIHTAAAGRIGAALGTNFIQIHNINRWGRCSLRLQFAACRLQPISELYLTATSRRCLLLFTGIKGGEDAHSAFFLSPFAFYDTDASAACGTGNGRENPVRINSP